MGSGSGQTYGAGAAEGKGTLAGGTTPSHPARLADHTFFITSPIADSIRARAEPESPPRPMLASRGAANAINAASTASPLSRLDIVNPRLRPAGGSEVFMPVLKQHPSPHSAELL
jgi:hypothetical protein